MEKSAHKASILTALIIIFQMLATADGDARSQIIQMTCDQQREHNQTLFIPNFVGMMGRLGAIMRNSSDGTAVVGTGPDGNYGLAQCYGDLSTQDCILCYAEARTVLPSCFPNNGDRIYLDGCFMRVQNYSFYQEYTGPNDTFVCTNTARKNSQFQDTVKQAVLSAVTDASRSSEYFGRVQMLVANGNESVYLLAECWRTLSASSCRACLDNASMSISKSTSSSINKGKIIAIVVSIFSSVTLITVAAMIAVYIWKHRYIQKKRKGSYDVKKLAKMLNDSSLNFKYSTIDKATGKWDESNKLGQGGFGTVYKGVLSDGREIAVKRLFFNKKFRAADFYNEVNMISSVEHKNLVRLLGCSCSGPESILIYEYLPNMSLDHFIFDLRLRAKDDKSNISTAIAGTLGYMAPEYLAHGQLTEKADVYSFGVLVLEVVTGIENNKSKNTEYTDSLVAILSIYFCSFFFILSGYCVHMPLRFLTALLLETVQAWNHFQQNKVEEIFDLNLMMHLYPNNNYGKEATKAIQVGLLCTQEDPSLRPAMATVLKMLAKDDEPLPAPSNPPFMDENAMELNEITHKLYQYFNTDNSCSIATVDHSHFFPR
ncbi:hypothetical protein L1987_79510 [Smallanthus sonchifolius]|uniref:Uncharacterized protein n=1 Tax=Smallanthus sonchifolius TaxID=185202 RepID=A0ACB8ZFZ6_9ASTR|nr:hypothetical protein L1987_79510 [Smallanthus sonchifolius]